MQAVHGRAGDRLLHTIAPLKGRIRGAGRHLWNPVEMRVPDSTETKSRSVDFRILYRDLRAVLKEGESDTDQALQAIVELLAAHFKSDVCSLYEIDNTPGLLVLKATKGLRPEAVGRTTLRIGEGLVGSVAQGLQTLSLEDAQLDARFVFRPETGEETYHSFLGVPLIRAQVLLGVLVVQHCEPRRYGIEEIEGCETVAQFLSEILNQGPSETIASNRQPGQASLRIAAVALNPGLAVGRVVHYLKDIVIRRWRSDDPAAELVRLKAALQDLEDSISALLHLPRIAADLEMSEVLEADLMLARDKGWCEKIEAAIGRGFSAEAAVQNIREDLRKRMGAISNDYLRERLLDLDDLSYRLLAKLTDEEIQQEPGGFPPNSILVCRSLGVSELLRVGQSGLAGLVVADATPSSHIAIVAASLKLPALGQALSALTELHEGDRIVLDAINGQLIARPSDSIVTQYDANISARRARDASERSKPFLPCQSRDGVAMQVMANAGLLIDLDEIVRSGADGIGLYRTEIAFLIRDQFPSVEDQARLYRKIYDRMKDKPVVFRTLDVGSDKKLPYFDAHQKEFNPALGWRAIRIGLDHPEMLCEQLRALLLAADGRALRVMLPMVSEVEEFAIARSLLMTLLDDFVNDGGKKPARIEIGTMIEVPALLWDLERLFEIVDFASVGTNDLFQFLTAADRNNPKTDTRFETLKPTNLRILTTIAETAARFEKPVGVCGEIAGTPLGLIAFVGCGFRSFSMAATRIAPARSVIRALDVAVVEERIQALATAPVSSVRDEIQNLAKEFDVEADTAF